MRYFFVMAFALIVNAFSLPMCEDTNIQAKSCENCVDVCFERTSAYYRTMTLITKRRHEDVTQNEWRTLKTSITYCVCQNDRCSLHDKNTCIVPRNISSFSYRDYDTGQYYNSVVIILSSLGAISFIIFAITLLIHYKNSFKPSIYHVRRIWHRGSPPPRQQAGAEADEDTDEDDAKTVV